MSLFDLPQQAKNSLRQLANRITTRVLPPHVDDLVKGIPVTDVPAEVAAALEGVRAEPLVARLVRPVPKSLLAAPLAMGRAVKAEIGAPGGSGVVALSIDRSGLLQWHLPQGPAEGEPEPAGGRAAPRQDATAAGPRKVEVWIRRVVQEGRTVRFFRLPTSAELTGQVVETAENLLKNEGMKRFPRTRAEALERWPRLGEAAEDEIDASGRVLILVHGIFDRVLGFVFAPLFFPDDTGFSERVHRHYGGRVYGFDHHTLGKSPFENAEDLLALLPDGLKLDILCHSRGGLVTRALLEHPTLRGRLDARQIEVGRVIFMGAANQGSQLARPDQLMRLLTIFTNLVRRAGAIPGLEPLAAQVSSLLVRVLQLVVTRAVDLPGIAELIPEGRLISELNASPVAPAGTYSFIRANFGDSKDLLLSQLEAISDRGFDSIRNDLVVPLDGMSDVGRARNVSGLHRLTLNGEMFVQPRWFHLNYLASPDVRRFIGQRLEIP